MTSVQKPIQGVNLGGWLVLEKWMTPALFAGTAAIDEYTLSSTAENRLRIQEHHKTFIIEEDFEWLSRHNVGLVRIPVGYWIFGDEPPFIGAIDRLDWAFKMAAKHGIRVLVCLHGAPGSQNGRDHSGKTGRAEWYEDEKLRSKTTSILLKLAERYKDEPALWGIELLNEPKIGVFQRKLRRFYYGSHAKLRAVLPPHVFIVFHDAFTPRLLSGALGRKSDVVMDIHWYHQAFLLHKWTGLGLYWWLIGRRGRLIDRLMKTQPVIIGEWSMILTGSILGKVPERQHLPLMAEHARRQQAAYSSALAWCYWTYKTESPGAWHFRSQVEAGNIVLV